MVRTRVGYAGGTTSSPTYHSIGDHAESIQIDFDPAVISYPELLRYYFAFHNPGRSAFSRQYMSAIFAHDASQRAAATRAIDAWERERGEKIATELTDHTDFTLAEDYHQKYMLRRQGELFAEYSTRFQALGELLDSPAVTRANGLIGGHGVPDLVDRDLPRLDLSPHATELLRRQWQRLYRPEPSQGCAR